MSVKLGLTFRSISKPRVNVKKDSQKEEDSQKPERLSAEDVTNLQDFFAWCKSSRVQLPSGYKDLDSTSVITAKMAVQACEVLYFLCPSISFVGNVHVF